MKSNSDKNTTCYASKCKINAKESVNNLTSIKELTNDTNFACIAFEKSKALDKNSKNDSSSLNNNNTPPILPPRRVNRENALENVPKMPPRKLQKKQNADCQTDFTRRRNRKLFLILGLGCVIAGFINSMIWMPVVWINNDAGKTFNRCLKIEKDFYDIAQTLQRTAKPVNYANMFHGDVIVTKSSLLPLTRRIISKGTRQNSGKHFSRDMINHKHILQTGNIKKRKFRRHVYHHKKGRGRGRRHH